MNTATARMAARLVAYHEQTGNWDKAAELAATVLPLVAVDPRVRGEFCDTYTIAAGQ